MKALILTEGATLLLEQGHDARQFGHRSHVTSERGPREASIHALSHRVRAVARARVPVVQLTYREKGPD